MRERGRGEEESGGERRGGDVKESGEERRGGEIKGGEGRGARGAGRVREREGGQAGGREGGMGEGREERLARRRWQGREARGGGYLVGAREMEMAFATGPLSHAAQEGSVMISGSEKRL